MEKMIKKAHDAITRIKGKEYASTSTEIQDYIDKQITMTQKDNNMSKLYDFVFHFNHFTELWAAIPRDLYTNYWNNDDVKGVIKSRDFNTLVEIITKEIQIEDTTFKKKSLWTKI